MQLILIGGAQRSGTTLLQTLLASALDAPILPEAHILCDMLASYKRATDTAKKTHFYYQTDDGLLSFFQFCANRHIADVIETVGARSVLVLKDPNFVQFDAAASAVFPDAIRIVCLRDPRDIAASFLRIGQRQQTRGKPSKYQKRDLQFISNKILTSYASLIHEVRPPNVVLVRYEDMVTEPKRTLEGIARETGLELSLTHIDDPAWLEADARHEASWATELEGHKPSPASKGAYKTVMRPREIASVEEACEPFMAWAGYENLPQIPRPKNLIRSIYKRLRRVYRAAIPRSPAKP
jgi:Sulfotransferase family